MDNSKPTRNGGLLVQHALIWAVAIIGLSYIFRGSEFNDALLMILIGLFAISNSFLMRAGKK